MIAGGIPRLFIPAGEEFLYGISGFRVEERQSILTGSALGISQNAILQGWRHPGVIRGDTHNGTKNCLANSEV